MLEALGVPTSKTLSLIETGEALVRHDEPSPTRAAVLTRLSFGHIRFGTFQRLAFFERADLISRLIDHVVEVYYPELSGLDASGRAPQLLLAITERAARLAARWTAAGFVHGVINSDNMNVTGESFDYGPYRFLPLYDPAFTAAYFDHYGLYAFGRQAEAVFWNLNQLAGALTLVAETEPLADALNRYGPAWREELGKAFARRLGVSSEGVEHDGELVAASVGFLAQARDRARFEPLFFDWFGGLASEPRARRGPRAELYAGEAFERFYAAIGRYSAERPERLKAAYFSRPEPEELLYDEIERIWTEIAERDDWRPFCDKIAAIGEARAALGIAEP
jgi:uncharacterized protein YdiU (UPF0061 family)